MKSKRAIPAQVQPIVLRIFSFVWRHRLQRLAIRLFPSIWVAEYCYCIYESSFAIISVHFSATEAYRSMKNHMLKNYQQEFDRRIRFGKQFSRGEKYSRDQAWQIRKVKLFP